MLISTGSISSIGVPSYPPGPYAFSPPMVISPPPAYFTKSSRALTKLSFISL